LPRLTPTEKRCTKCEETKPVAEFYKQSDSRDGLTVHCRECRKAKVRERSERDAERISVLRKALYHKDPSKFIARTAEWCKKNPEKARANARRYSATEHGLKIKLAARHRRLARLAGVFVAESVLVTPEWFQSVIGKQRGLCYYCWEPRKLEIEHIVPISRGGLHIRENIVAACATCNRSKGAKLVTEWRVG
jgi:5-methylcytosine-specific restriction endonuclease McrA